jgi:hypothetical protein
LIEAKETIIFVDEAVFTSRLQSCKVWARARRKAPEVFKSKIGFKAIAITGGLDVEGMM